MTTRLRMSLPSYTFKVPPSSGGPGQICRRMSPKSSTGLLSFRSRGPGLQRDEIRSVKRTLLRRERLLGRARADGPAASQGKTGLFSAGELKEAVAALA